MRGRDWLPRAIVSIGSEPEPDYSFLGLFGTVIELRQACQISGHQWKNTGRHWIECAQVSHGALSQESPHAIDDIVGSQACRLVYNQNAIHVNIVSDGPH